jgi:hypothetical protein
LPAPSHQLSFCLKGGVIRPVYTHSGHTVPRGRNQRVSSCELTRSIHHAGRSTCARHSCGAVMCVRWTPPNWNTVAGSCGNATDRGRKFEKGFGRGGDGTDDRNSAMQRGDNGPAKQRCDTTQVKAKAKAIRRHSRMTPNILVPGRSSDFVRQRTYRTSLPAPAHLDADRVWSVSLSFL